MPVSLLFLDHVSMRKWVSEGPGGEHIAHELRI